ncbi:MAG: beta strand repeat-containing protein [Myxococcota bacterium]
MRILLTTFGLLSACENISKDNPDGEDTGEVITDTNDLEPGCFTVDGGSGYALLNDAILMASDGSTITMEGCAGQHEEVVNVTKAVSIVGPGSSSFTLIPPTNENGINITASGVSLSGIGIVSTRSGISIEGASLVSLEDIEVSGAGNWGVKANASEVEITNSVFNANGFGGVSADSSSLTVANSEINDNTSYGVYAISSSTVDIDASSVMGTLSSGSQDTQDGIGVYIENNSMLLANDTDLSGGAIFSTYSVNASTFLTDVIAGQTTFGAIWAEGTGELSLNGVTIDEAPGYGIIAQITGAVSIENSSLTTDSALSPSTNAETWRDDGFLSMGFFTNSPSVTVNGFSISGYNNCGAYFTTSETDAQLSVDGLTLTEIGRLGAYVIGYEGEMNNFTIDGIYELDGVSEPDVNTVCSYVDRYVGAVIVDNIDLNNVTLSNIEGYGITAIQSSTVIDTLVAQNNTCASVMAFESAMFLSNADFALPNPKQTNLGANLIGYNATTLSVENSSFEGLPYVDAQYDYLMFAYNTSDVQIRNSTFSNSYYGYFSDNSELTASENTFENLYGISLYFGGGTTSNHIIEKSNFIGGPDTQSYLTYCFSGGQVEISDTTYSNTSTNAVYLNSCSSEFDTVNFENIGGAAINAIDSDHEWDKLTLNNVGVENFASAAISLNAYNGPSLFSLSSSVLTNVGNDGIRMYSLSSSNPITAFLDDLTITDVVDDGIYSYGTVVQLANSSISNSSGDGINISGNTFSLNNATVSASSTHGISCTNADLTMSNLIVDQSGINGLNASYCTIDSTSIGLNNSGTNGMNLNYSPFTGSDTSINGTNSDAVIAIDSALSFSTGNISSAGGDGIDLSGQGSSITLDQMTISNSAGTGVRISNTSGTITNNNITNSQEYAFVCTDSDSTFCNNNILIGNLLGEQTGCDLSCGIEANPVDAPVDTGEPNDTGDTGEADDSGIGPVDTASPPPPPIDTADTGS